MSTIDRDDGTVEVQVGVERYRVAAGTRLQDFLGAETIRRDEIVAAVLDNQLVDLRAEIAADAVVRPVHRSHVDGRSVVRRAVKMMLHALLVELYPAATACVGQSLAGGYFYNLTGESDLEGMALRLSEALAALADAEEPFQHRTVPIEAALRSLSDPSGAKARLLEAWTSPQVPIVSLRAFRDIEHGPYPPTTRAGRDARVLAYPPGLILQFPGEPAVSGPDEARRLWATCRDSREQQRRLGVNTVGDLNRAVLDGRIDEVIRVAEALHEKKVAEIADAVAAGRGRARLVCVAGPSSSGKTTFVERLRVQLRVLGLEPHVVNLDDYYRPRDETPRDENGDYDFEALEALQLPLLNEHLATLVAGGEIRVPRFDFRLQRPRPESEWRPLRLGPDALLMLEGIHGLNPRLYGDAAGATFGIFVSALSPLVIDEHNRIFTSELRLLRRIVRDRRYRGTSVAETIERWPSVRRGEERHIFPFQERADVIFDSSLVYETAVLKSFAARYLLEVPRQHPARLHAWRMMKFLELFIPVFPDGVPATSVLREFVGGSAFA